MAPAHIRGMARGRILRSRGFWPKAREVALARWLIVLGVVLVLAGLLWPWLTRLGLGRLPGDIVIERENLRFYLPITTSILISIVLSLILWLINR
jgi:Protein of unknown function (DUF2905)